MNMDTRSMQDEAARFSAKGRKEVKPKGVVTIPDRGEDKKAGFLRIVRPSEGADLRTKEDRPLKGLEPSFSKIDEVDPSKLSAEDRKYFDLQTPEEKQESHLAEVRSKIAEWEKDHAQHVEDNKEHYQEVNKWVNKWRGDDIRAEQEEGRRSADRPWMDAKDKALQNIARQERLSDLEAKIEAASRAVRVETEIKNNPDGPLARLRKRIQAVFKGNR